MAYARLLLPEQGGLRGAIDSTNEPLLLSTLLEMPVAGGDVFYVCTDREQGAVLSKALKDKYLASKEGRGIWWSNPLLDREDYRFDGRLKKWVFLVDVFWDVNDLLVTLFPANTVEQRIAFAVDQLHPGCVECATNSGRDCDAWCRAASMRFRAVWHCNKCKILEHEEQSARAMLEAEAISQFPVDTIDDAHVRAQFRAVQLRKARGRKRNLPPRARYQLGPYQALGGPNPGARGGKNPDLKLGPT